MIPYGMTSFKFICVLYQFHRKTLPITKIDRGQSNFESMFQQERNLDEISWTVTFLCDPKLDLSSSRSLGLFV